LVLAVHALVPGLIVWAEVHGSDQLLIPKKVKLDVAYLQRQPLWLDLHQGAEAGRGVALMGS